MEEKGFEQDYIPGLDELAMRLQVDPQEEPYTGIVLLGKSGNAYPLIQILANQVQFTAEAVEIMLSVMEEVKKEGESSESDKGSGQPKKADNTTGNTKSNKS